MPNIERLRKLEGFLRNLPAERWNFGSVVTAMDAAGCGSTCCALGWLPAIFPEDWKYNVAPSITDVQLKTSAHTTVFGPGYRHSFKEAALYFGITDDDCNELFSYEGANDEQEPSFYYSRRESYRDVTPVDVADAINEFIREGVTS